MSTKGFKTLAEAISTSRKKLGITQRELSRRTNIDNNTIAKIEKGERKKPNVLSLKKLAFALDIDSDKLLKLAGYTKEEIKIANDDASVNAFQRRDDKKIILLSEVLVEAEKKNEAYNIVMELIDNCDLSTLKVMKNKSKKEIEDLKTGLKYIKEDIQKQLNNYDEYKRRKEENGNKQS